LSSVCPLNELRGITAPSRSPISLTAKTGNVFIETISSTKSGALGWMLKTQADYVIYDVPRYGKANKRQQPWIAVATICNQTIRALPRKVTPLAWHTNGKRGPIECCHNVGQGQEHGERASFSITSKMVEIFFRFRGKCLFAGKGRPSSS
jgi:hypothetical protein